MSLRPIRSRWLPGGVGQNHTSSNHDEQTPSRVANRVAETDGNSENQPGLPKLPSMRIIAILRIRSRLIHLPQPSDNKYLAQSIDFAGNWHVRPGGGPAIPLNELIAGLHRRE